MSQRFRPRLSKSYTCRRPKGDLCRGRSRRETNTGCEGNNHWGQSNGARKLRRARIRRAKLTPSPIPCHRLANELDLFQGDARWSWELEQQDRMTKSHKSKHVWAALLRPIPSTSSHRADTSLPSCILDAGVGSLLTITCGT
jgi:hypothetical protein